MPYILLASLSLSLSLSMRVLVHSMCIYIYVYMVVALDNPPPYRAIYALIWEASTAAGAGSLQFCRGGSGPGPLQEQGTVALQKSRS